MVKTWLAAAIAGALLLAGGIGGYFIGAANDHDGNRPGISRFGDHRPNVPPGYRDFRGPVPRER